MFDGYAVSQNMPPLLSLPLDRLCNFIYWFHIREAGSEDVEEFRAKLWVPPVGAEVTDERSPWSPEAETSALLGLQAALGGPGNMSS